MQYKNIFSFGNLSKGSLTTSGLYHTVQHCQDDLIVTLTSNFVFQESGGSSISSNTFLNGEIEKLSSFATTNCVMMKFLHSKTNILYPLPKKFGDYSEMVTLNFICP